MNFFSFFDIDGESFLVNMDHVAYITTEKTGHSALWFEDDSSIVVEGDVDQIEGRIKLSREVRKT